MHRTSFAYPLLLLAASLLPTGCSQPTAGPNGGAAFRATFAGSANPGAVPAPAIPARDFLNVDDPQQQLAEPQVAILSGAPPLKSKASTGSGNSAAAKGNMNSMPGMNMTGGKK